MTSEQAEPTKPVEPPVRPIKDQAEFNRVVREAMQIFRDLEVVDTEEKAAKAAATKEADKKRKRLNPRFDRRMDRVMAYVLANHPGVFKGGDKDQFETDELIVRFHKDGNGSLKILSEALILAYVERRKELRETHVKIVKSFTNATKFKQWMRANPLRRPPASIVYRDTISFVRKLTAAEKRRGKKADVLTRVVAER